MRSGVGGLQARRLYPSVDLRRAHGAVAEQLLDRPQVGAAVQEVRRERVAQRVRRDPALDRGLSRPCLQTAPDVRRGQPAAGLGEEQRLARRRRSAAPGGRVRASARRRAAPARRPGRAGSCGPFPRRGPPRPRTRCSRRRGRRAPRRAGRTRRRARTARGRGARAASSRGCDRAAPRSARAPGRAAASTAACGAGTRSAGFAGTSPCSMQDAIQLAQRRQLAGRGASAPARRSESTCA